jgi:hypothetical protein
MKRVLIAAVAAFALGVLAPLSANASADAYPWKLLLSAPNGNLFIAHEYTTEAACRADGESTAREQTAVNCTGDWCAVKVWCFNKQDAEVTAAPGTAAPLKPLRCHPAYYGIAPGATRPAQHPGWCE